MKSLFQKIQHFEGRNHYDWFENQHIKVGDVKLGHGSVVYVKMPDGKVVRGKCIVRNSGTRPDSIILDQYVWGLPMTLMPEMFVRCRAFVDRTADLIEKMDELEVEKHKINLKEAVCRGKMNTHKSELNRVKEMVK